MAQSIKFLFLLLVIPTFTACGAKKLPPLDQNSSATLIPNPVPVSDPGISNPTPSNPVDNFLSSLYLKALSRQIETDGLIYWGSFIRNNNTLIACLSVEVAVLNSPEFNSRGLPDDAFVETVYVAVLNRASDGAGKTFWLNQMASGLSRPQLIDLFANTTEAANSCRTQLGVP